jgi:hypothetical protein
MSSKALPVVRELLSTEQSYTKVRGKMSHLRLFFLAPASFNDKTVGAGAASNDGCILQASA